MDNMAQIVTANALINQLSLRGLFAFKSVSGSGSIYVYLSGSRMKVRIANHGKHRGWFRYNIRTDLKKSREFRLSGQRVFLFSETDIVKACNRIAKDFETENTRNANALIKSKKRRMYRGSKKTRR